MASMVSSWDDVVRRASEASGQPRGATLFLLGLALAPAIALGFPILGVALDVARVRDARVRARVQVALAKLDGITDRLRAIEEKQERLAANQQGCHANCGCVVQ